VNPLELVTGSQQAAVGATGVADAIAAGPREAEAVAAVCGTDPRATRSLLGGLARSAWPTTAPAATACRPTGPPWPATTRGR
jgi:hypothetical protein